MDKYYHVFNIKDLNSKSHTVNSLISRDLHHNLISLVALLMQITGKSEYEAHSMASGFIRRTWQC